jgi:hypothetical protein
VAAVAVAAVAVAAVAVTLPRAWSPMTGWPASAAGACAASAAGACAASAAGACEAGTSGAAAADVAVAAVFGAAAAVAGFNPEAWTPDPEAVPPVPLGPWAASCPQPVRARAAMVRAAALRVDVARMFLLWGPIAMV